MEIPKHYISYITNFFKPKNLSVVGIDIGSSSIKVVQLKNQEGRAVLETYGELATGPYASMDVGRSVRLVDSKLIEALKDVFREAKITAEISAMAIPLSSSMITVIEVPMMTEDQLPKIIPFEARKYIPVSVAEVTLDWLPVPNPKLMGGVEGKEGETAPADPNAPNTQEKMEVLLVAIHNEALNRYRDLAKDMALKTDFFEVETFADIRASVDDDTLPTMVFDFGASSTKLNIVEKGIVRMSHVINRGSQDITIALARSLNVGEKDAETMKRAFVFDKANVVGSNEAMVYEVVALTMGHIFSETNRVINNFKIKYAKNVDKIILTGGGAVLNGFEKIAKEALEANVVRSNPFNKVVTPAFFEETLKKVGPSLSVALGIALRRLRDEG